MNLISKEEIPWTIAFVKKTLAFFVIVNVAVLPFLLIFRIDLRVYSLIISYEGFCLMILGGFSLFVSLFSTVERDTYRYAGNGFFRRGAAVRRLRGGEKRLMRLRGLIMMMLGLLFWAVNFLVIWFAALI